MAYEFEDKKYLEEDFIKSILVDSYSDSVTQEINEIYQKAKLLDGVVATTKRRISEQEVKAKAWDKMYEMLIDTNLSIEDFDNEMYQLLKETGKEDIKIIKEPNIKGNVYTILYSEYDELLDCYKTYSDGTYFTTKDLAIKHLEDEGYKFISDNEYSINWYLHAEILELGEQK